MTWLIIVLAGVLALYLLLGLVTRYRLEKVEAEHGRGYRVWRKDGLRLEWDDLPASEGLEVVAVSPSDDGEPWRDVFAPGRAVELVPESADPITRTIAVWDAQGEARFGYLSSDDVMRIGPKLDSIEEAVVVWESPAGRERKTIKVLLAREEASVMTRVPRDNWFFRGWKRTYEFFMGIARGAPW
jgi:hypothetical protein